MTDTDREARLEEIEQDLDAYKVGDAVDVQIKAVDRRGDAGPAITLYRKAPRYIDWLLSEIDRLKAKLEGEDG